MSDDRCDLLCLDLPRAETIRQHLNETAIVDAAARAKALGDPTRLTIAVALREGAELCVFACRYEDEPTGGHDRAAVVLRAGV